MRDGDLLVKGEGEADLCWRRRRQCSKGNKCFMEKVSCVAPKRLGEKA